MFEQLQNKSVMVISWFRVLTAGAMKVRRDPRLELMGTDLVIKNLELEDRGEYDCEVESDREVPVSIRHSLDILHPPTATPEPNSGGNPTQFMKYKPE